STLASYLFNHTSLSSLFFIFFLSAPAPSEIYTLSLHDALPIYPTLALEIDASHQLVDLQREGFHAGLRQGRGPWNGLDSELLKADRKSTRLNSSHVSISYAVFCLKKKKKIKKHIHMNSYQLRHT